MVSCGVRNIRDIENIVEQKKVIGDIDALHDGMYGATLLANGGIWV